MKTQDILLLGGLAVAAYYFLFMKDGAGAGGGGGGGGGGNPQKEKIRNWWRYIGGGGGIPDMRTLGFVSPPTSGPGSSGSNQGLFTQTIVPNLGIQETLMYGGQGYSVRESNVQNMVNQLSSAASVKAAQQTNPTAQQNAIAAAQTYYSGGGAPSYSGSKPSNIMTGMSVRQDQPFISSVTAKPIGFK